MSTAPVAERLRRAVAARKLQFDASQFEAAQRLDHLSATLKGQPPTFIRRLRTHLPWAAGAPPPRGLYLWGGVGRGKTLLMDLFFATLQTAPEAAGTSVQGSDAGGKTAVRDNVPAAERCHFYRFMRQVHADLRAVKRRTNPLDVVAQRLAHRVRVLCLDEFFVADIADAMILAGLFDGLFRRGVTLVATSNLAPQDLYKDGLQRQRFVPAIDLLGKHVEVIHLDGGVDYRLRELEQAPTYLDASLTSTEASMQRRFESLAGGFAGGPATLIIEGRALEAVRTAPGMVWFEFDELCTGPRSQNDYIELARLYHTIFIAHIPSFTHADEDAARRFIMLLDELYDRGVNIVVSAAAAPATLYHGERQRFEFQRAASRLVEMQTRHYLAGGHRP